MARLWFFGMAASATTLAVGVLGIIPTRRLAGAEALAALAAGCSLSLLASLAGALPVALARRTAQPVVVALGAMGLRLGLLIAGGLLLALASGLHRPALLVWVGISHLALLPLDVRFVLGGMRRNSGTELLERS